MFYTGGKIVHGVFWIFYFNLRIYFGDQTLAKVSFASMFSLMVGSFCFNAVFFSHAEAFYFDEIPFVYSFPYVSCFRGHVCEDVAAWNM